MADVCGWLLAVPGCSLAVPWLLPGCALAIPGWPLSSGCPFGFWLRGDRPWSPGCFPQVSPQPLPTKHSANRVYLFSLSICFLPCKKKFSTLPDLCVSSLRRGHANLLCIIPILTDDPRRESEVSLLNSTRRGVSQLSSQGQPALDARRGTRLGTHLVEASQKPHRSLAFLEAS